ncbi:MAG TPA: nuclear transport factor 2 family protein [Gaiellales bacterium]|jgi:hypothetical protein|nr:nuclear transport factor 2 family protein [Gaiellales bacterium]
MDAEQLRDRERERLRLLVAADIERASPFHADDYQLIHPGGGALSKEEYLGMLASGEFRYVVWEPGDMAVRVYRDAAVLRYQATIETQVDGGRVDRGRYWHIDLYESRDGPWQVVWSQATEIE